MNKFELVSKFKPSGDQPRAIEKLVDGLRKGYRHQTLLGVTGSGKTFTVANVIEKIQKPTLVIAHNKTLAAQLTNEFRELFPHNSVNYFVSYYDYYQPEAYMPTTDTYIEKEAMINDEIDRLRHAATTALLTRRDVIVVASVSCIYGLGAPEIYAENILHFKKGDEIERRNLMRKLIELQFMRTTADLKRGTFRLRGEHWEIMPPDREIIYDLDVKNGMIREIYEVDPVRGKTIESSASKVSRASNGVDPVVGFRPARHASQGEAGRPESTPTKDELYVAPAKHFITPYPERERAIGAIRKELAERLKFFESQGKLLEAERLERRTKFDIAMIQEVGYCHGIENYSRHLSGRGVGEPPETLLDYFFTRHSLGEGGPRDFLTIIDESHVTVPQLGGMYEGDASRKKTLIEYGFRLPSAADNRPLRFPEFEARVGQIIYTSATPGAYERKHSDPSTNSGQVVEQIVRPTGLVDPKITIRPASAGHSSFGGRRPARGQVDDLIPRIEERIEKKERVLVTTLTKKMAEDLTEYLASHKPLAISRQPKVAYLHSDVKTLDRIRILTDLRKGKFDVLVGVNLLREGLDLPEVSLVAILDADKEGFLRSETSLIQTIGRAARNVAGEVLIYADIITGSVERAINETERRREVQLAYNKKHGITPRTIEKAIKDILPEGPEQRRRADVILELESKPLPKSRKAIEELMRQKEKEMREAANNLDFELAAILRDEIRALSKNLSSRRKIFSNKT